MEYPGNIQNLMDIHQKIIENSQRIIKEEKEKKKKTETKMAKEIKKSKNAK